MSSPFDSCTVLSEIVDLSLSSTPRDPREEASANDLQSLKAAIRRVHESYSGFYLALLRQISAASQKSPSQALYLTAVASRLFRLRRLRRAAQMMKTIHWSIPTDHLKELSFPASLLDTYCERNCRYMLTFLASVLSRVPSAITLPQSLPTLTTFVFVFADVHAICVKKYPDLGRSLITEGWRLILEAARQHTENSKDLENPSVPFHLLQASMNLQACMDPDEDADDQLQALEYLVKLEKALDYQARPTSLWDAGTLASVSEYVDELKDTLSGEDYEDELDFLQRSLQPCSFSPPRRVGEKSSSLDTTSASKHQCISP